MISNYAVENIIFTIVFLVSLLCFRHNKLVATSLIVTNCIGLTLPVIGLNQYAPFGFLLGAFICLIGCKRSKNNEINHAIAYLFCIRVIVDLPKIAGFSGVELTWLISMALLFIQLLIALGEGIGYGSRINHYFARVGRMLNDSLFHKG